MSQKRFNPWLKLIEAQKPLFLACEILNIDDRSFVSDKNHIQQTNPSQETKSNTQAIIPRKRQLTAGTGSPDPRLVKIRLKGGYDASMALRTIIIDPFMRDKLNDTNFIKWLDQCESYTIKNVRGRCLAQLVFPTSIQGDLAMATMRNSIGMKEVSHPMMHSRLSDAIMPGVMQRNIVESRLKDMEPSEDFYTRILVIEGLKKETNAEEVLVSIFPEAMTAVSYQYDPLSEGIAVLEFETLAKVEEFLSKKCTNNKMFLEDSEIKVFKYTDRADYYSMVHHAENEAKTQQWEYVEESLSDHERLHYNAEIGRLQKDIDTVQDHDDIIGYAKIERARELFDQAREYKRVLTKDTNRRLKLKMPFPEREEDMQLFTVSCIKSKKGYSGRGDQENVLAQLKGYDKEYETSKQETEKLYHKIISVEGNLTLENKVARRKKRKLVPYIEQVQREKPNIPRSMNVVPSLMNHPRSVNMDQPRSINIDRPRSINVPSLMDEAIRPVSNLNKRGGEQSSSSSDGPAIKRIGLGGGIGFGRPNENTGFSGHSQMGPGRGLESLPRAQTKTMEAVASVLTDKIAELERVQKAQMEALMLDRRRKLHTERRREVMSTMSDRLLASARRDPYMNRLHDRELLDYPRPKPTPLIDPYSREYGDVYPDHNSDRLHDRELLDYPRPKPTPLIDPYSREYGDVYPDHNSDRLHDRELLDYLRPKPTPLIDPYSREYGDVYPDHNSGYGKSRSSKPDMVVFDYSADNAQY